MSATAKTARTLRKADVWSQHDLLRASGCVVAAGTVLQIALINNMPDAALLRTEQQFTALLESAAEGLKVNVARYSLPVVARARAWQDHIAAFYRPIEQLWRTPADAIVVTGTEPRERALQDESYWTSLTELFDWADCHCIPAMLSCLAAHAAVLYTDGVRRQPLDKKCFGVFDHDVEQDHLLTNGAGQRMWLPHTRWNEITETELTEAGYDILSRSVDAGVGFFAKERGSVWLYCQGHPEYDGPNLLREYRRDVLRFLRKERPTYPELPRCYLGTNEMELLCAFRERALVQADESIMNAFPRELPSGPTWDAWRPAAVRIFSNWITNIAVRKSVRSACVAAQ